MITITTHQFDNGMNFHSINETHNVTISLNYLSNSNQPLTLSSNGQKMMNDAILPLLAKLLQELE